jgi:hypothetical protein
VVNLRRRREAASTAVAAASDDAGALVPTALQLGVPPAVGTATGDFPMSIIDPGNTGWFYGGPLPGMIAEDVALSIPAVRRGVNVIAGAICTFALDRWRGDLKIDPGSFLEFPENYRPYPRTMFDTARSLVLYPYAWWQVVERNRAGFPSRVRWLDPAYVSFSHVFGTAEFESEYAFYKAKRVPVGDLICFEGLDQGLLCYGRTTILTALALEMAANRYASPEIPTGYLKQEGMYEITEGESDDLLDRWERSRRRRNTAYLNAGLSYNSVQSTAAELQLVEGREQSARQVARLLNIPFRYMGVDSGNSMTYSNIASERADFVDLCLAPYMAAITGRLSMPDRNGSPRGQRVQFDLDAFLRGAPADRVARSKTLVELGVMTRDEARALEGLPGPAPALQPGTAEPGPDVEPGADGQTTPTSRDITDRLSR